MAGPISAYFGRDTHAMLSRCTYCGKPYNESERWHTMQFSSGKVDVWGIACDKCYREPAHELRGDA